MTQIAPIAQMTLIVLMALIAPIAQMTPIVLMAPIAPIPSGSSDF